MSDTQRVLFSLAVTVLVVVGTIYAIKYPQSASGELPDGLSIQRR